MHHLKMTHYVVGYLHTTEDLPLVLGGAPDVQVTGFSDSSFGTGPKGRSISGWLIKLNEEAGAVFSKSSAGHSVTMSTFESELDAATSAMKSLTIMSNMVEDLGLPYKMPALLYCDNKAMVDFVKGEGVARGARHMERRLWYTRERVTLGKIFVFFMEGKRIPADKLTKLGNKQEHRAFTKDILGLGLIGYHFADE